MPAYKDKNTGTWFAKFQYRKDGKPATKLKRGFKTKKEALAFERKFIETYAPSVDMTFDELSKVFVETKRREYRPNTLRGYQVVIGSRYVDRIRAKKVTNITGTDMLEVRSAMSDLSAASVNLYMSKLSKIFDFAVNMYDLYKNPCRGLNNLAVSRKEMRYMTVEDIERLKAIPGVTEETQLLIDVLFWTGMRISEAVALTVGDYHGTYIAVHKHKIRTDGGMTTQHGLKNNHGRNVLINDTLAREIESYIFTLDRPDRDTELFPRHIETYWERMRRLFALANIPDMTLHSFRHSHVALLIHLGFSPKLIADRIGDKVETMLNVYAHIYPEDMQDVVDRLENVSNSYQPHCKVLQMQYD
jgi:integrase